MRVAPGRFHNRLKKPADVSTGTVSKLEERAGMDPSWSTVCKLADALGVSVEDFRGKGAREGARRRGPKGKGG